MNIIGALKKLTKFEKTVMILFFFQIRKLNVIENGVIRLLVLWTDNFAIIYLLRFCHILLLILMPLYGYGFMVKNGNY